MAQDIHHRALHLFDGLASHVCPDQRLIVHFGDGLLLNNFQDRDNRLLRFCSGFRRVRTRLASSIFLRMTGWSEERMKKIHKKPRTHLVERL